MKMIAGDLCSAVHLFRIRAPTGLRLVACFTALVVGLFFTAPAPALASYEDEWSVQTLAGHEGGPLVIATTTNREGFTFFVARLEADGTIVGVFNLPGWIDDELDPQHLPVVAVDARPLLDLDRLVVMAKHAPGFWYLHGPSSFGFRIWHGAEAAGIGKHLLELMSGDTLSIQFHLQKDGKQNTFFALSGAKSAISSAVGINPNFDRGEQAALSALNSLLGEELERCIAFDGRKQDYCVNRLFACEQLSEGDVDALIECLDY